VTIATTDLVCVRIGRSNLPAHLDWAYGQQFWLPAGLLCNLRFGKHDGLEGQLRLISQPDMPLAQLPEAMRLRAAFTDQRPLSSRLPISYQRIPQGLRSVVASMMGRWKRHRLESNPHFPMWPLDLSADFLADALGSGPCPFAGGPTPVLLTHDLDSAEGLENLVHSFLAGEEAVGARSTSYVVPCSWPIDHHLLAETRQRGHDLGIHGHDHANRTAFLAEDQLRERLREAQPLIDAYDIIGYRSPSLLRTRTLLRSLGSFYRYDSSMPTSGGLFPVPQNGCASARPFLVEGIVEIPISLPRDGSLRFLGYTPRQILELWVACAEKISRSGGVVVLLTHCEKRFSGNQPMLGIYQQFLEYLASSGRYLWSTPAEVLDAVKEQPWLAMPAIPEPSAVMVTGSAV
jgi:peptidoglycan/xylan/chitin deacetylase (PgdA/CDA1 family)